MMKQILRTKMSLLLLGGLFSISLLLTFMPFQLNAQQAGLPAAAVPNAGPDLLIESITITPADPKPGERVTINPTVKNQGNESAPGFSLHIYLEPNGVPDQVTAETNRTFYGIGLTAGEMWSGYSVTPQQTVTQEKPLICVWVDRDNGINEDNEENNLLCLNVPPPPPVTSDAYEQDDSCALAKEITPDGTNQERNLARENGQADQDWIKLSVQSGVRYVVDATNVGADADVFVELYATCEAPSTFGADIHIEFTALIDGIYYLKVGHKQAEYGSESGYQIHVTRNAACTASYEPNNSCFLPTEMVAGETRTLDFCQANDVDWTRFEVKAGGTYSFKLQNIGNKADAQMQLYTSCTGSSVQEGAEFSFTASQSGWAYVKNENKDPQIFGSETTYTIEIKSDGQGCDPDQYENPVNDNSLANAQPARINGNIQTRTICPAGDQDWIQIQANAGMTYTVETLNLGDNADTYLCEYSATGQELRCDDDSGEGKGSRLILRNANQGSYFYRVNDIDPSVAGQRAQYGFRVITNICQKDGFEPDDSRDTARPISTDGTLQQHNICADQDEDWVSFTALANTLYTIETTETGPEGDTIIEVYDSNGALLAQNDDHTPQIESQILYQINTPGTYYVRTFLYNPTSTGKGTEYSLKVKAGPATPAPTDTPEPPVPTPTPEPPAPCGNADTCVDTLILVNRARLVDLYDETQVDLLMTKLNTLAQHPQVRGEIIQVEKNETVSAAYTTWISDITNVAKANDLTNVIKQVIMTYRSERDGVDYVVLVGDDRALPFRRVQDNTEYPENTYNEVTDNHPTGAAIRQNYFLTDDFFVDQEPTPHQGREIYIPDLPIGRLIENPMDIISIIDAFLADPVTDVSQALVTGYDFVWDTAVEECQAWRKAIGGPEEQVSCLIQAPSQAAWNKQQFTDLHLRTDKPFLFQSINGHAFHRGEGIASGGALSTVEISSAPVVFPGGLIYTLGCHSGLNVPPDNVSSPVDLPEVFVRKGANYIGNTGYGLGLLSTIGLSEKMIRLFTNRLLKGTGTLGGALVTAKQLYYGRDPDFSAADEKVMQELVFYGLPMFRIEGLVGTLDGSEFPPEIEFSVTAPTDDSFGDDLITRTIPINYHISDGLVTLNATNTESGNYLDLSGFTHADTHTPVQPLHFGSLTGATSPPARSVIILGGVLETASNNFDPLVGTPINEYTARNAEDEAALTNIDRWYPAVPATVRTLNGQSQLVTQLGQFNPARNELRVLNNLDVQIYYSTSPDYLPPDIKVIDALYTPKEPNSLEGRLQVKVGVTDSSGIKEVYLTYIVDNTAKSIKLESTRLQYNEASQKWVGSFDGGANSRFYVQVVDNAGNDTKDDNKGYYYRASENVKGTTVDNPTQVYLPLVSK